MAKSRIDEAFEDVKELVAQAEARLLGRSRIQAGHQRQSEAKQTAAARKRSGQQRQSAAKQAARTRARKKAS